MTNLSLIKLQVRYIALFLLFSVTDSFEQFWMGSLHKNIQLMLEFLITQFLVLHFSYSTLMIFLMMLSVTLLSKLMTLLTFLKLIRHLTCGSNLIWLLKLNLIHETLQTGTKERFLGFNAGKTQVDLFDQSNNTGSINVKMDEFVFED